MKDFVRLVYLDTRMQVRRAAEWAALILFFILVLLLLPFALGPEPDLLRRLAPGLIWLAALLMSLLALEKLFVNDARDGTLDLMLLSPLPLPLIVLARLGAVIFVILAALIVMLVPAALLLGLSLAVLPVLVLTLMLGVPAMVMIGGIAGALTAGLPRSPALLTLLLVPFYIPVLIFAVAACDAALSGAVFAAPLLLLGAIFMLALSVSPFVIAAALRHAQD